MYRPHISRRGRATVSILLVVGLAASIWHLRSVHKQALLASRARAARELVYIEEASSLKQVIVPGMLRQDVETVLEAKSLSFTLRSGSGTHDEIVPLAHEPSPRWACNWEQVQLLITFAPAGTAAPSPQDSTGFSQARPDDRVKAVALDHWLRDCM